MTVFANLAKLLLPLLVVMGILGTHKLANDNGLFTLLEKTVASKRLPDTRQALKMHWIGLEGVDNFFAAMVTFFWTAIDGRHPSLMLQGLHFLGQLSSIWVLLVVESFRVGNAWRAIAFITLWGLALEHIAMAVAVPLYCFVHLLTSPTSKSANTQTLALRKTNLLVHPANLSILPWSLAIGHFVPVAMMYFCKDGVVAPFYLSKQFWIVARLFHPVITAAVHLLLSMVGHSADVGYANAAQRNREVLRSLNNVYTFATFIAAVPHVATLTLLMIPRVAPPLLTSKYLTLFTPTALWRPVYFWEAPIAKVPNVGVGAAIFLQWDEIVSVSATLIWAIAVNRQGVAGEPAGSSWFNVLLKTALMTLVGGPAAAAIALIQERDQVVLDKLDAGDEKKRI